MLLLPDGRILLSGGATVDEKGVPVYHKDLRQLDTETMLWSKAKTAGGTHYLHSVFFGLWQASYRCRCLGLHVSKARRVRRYQGFMADRSTPQLNDRRFRTR